MSKTEYIIKKVTMLGQSAYCLYYTPKGTKHEIYVGHFLHKPTKKEIDFSMKKRNLKS